MKCNCGNEGGHFVFMDEMPIPGKEKKQVRFLCLKCDEVIIRHCLTHRCVND